MQSITRITAILAISAASFGLAQAQSSLPTQPSTQYPASAPPPSKAMPSSKSVAPASKGDMGEGVIKAVDMTSGSITFASGQTLKVKDPAGLSKLKEGQIIEYRTEAGDAGPVIVAVKILG